MVMETPSPQCVGREFVRQYYTLLHEAPLHLHRFYSHNSSFVHGGVEKPGEEQPPVMGQTEIHKKIMSLNFRDCHAKIRQVDSQATVGNAVVVQVTGELSNNGQPMRRFMQTFVLAPQSTKKYYVHNDIFRYQDEVFHDNESDIENPEERVLSDSEPEIQEDTPQIDVIEELPPDSFIENLAPLSNGTAHLEDRAESPGQKSVEEQKEESITEEPLPEEKVEEEMIPESSLVPEEEPPDVEQKPFSWAAMASKNTSSAPAVHQTTVIKSPQGFGKPEPRSDLSAPLPQRNTANRPPRRDREGRERDNRGSVARSEGDADDGMGARRGSRFPDNQQLFVGNLPHNIAEKDLRTFFEGYGSVVELRINTKSSGGKLPNFGFVVFDNPETVQQILSMKPIRYNGEHRLNVEEKKPRGDGRMGGGRGGPPRGMMGGGVGARGGFGGMSRGGIRNSTPSGGGFGSKSSSSGGGTRGAMSGPRR
ncbi:hypothetical protein ScPMuIL_003555 [Solemya velum]